MRFPRIVRLDASDLSVFERAAEPGEWAVTGSFAFADGEPGALAGKARQAFRNGWLGTASFGHASLVEVAEIDAAEFEAVVERLALRFVAFHGAPGVEAARPVARDEALYAASLADHKINTLLALAREAGPEGVIERVRAVRPPRAADHAKIWTLAEDEPDA